MEKKIKYLIIHCSASDRAEDCSYEAIEKLHKSPVNMDMKWGKYQTQGKGFKDIGYQRVIEKDGTEKRGRGDLEIGAHTKGYNHNSIGICLIGDKEFTEAQFDTLRKLVKELKAKYSLRNANIQGHSAFNRLKTCPNFDTHEVLKDVLIERDAVRIAEDNVQDNITRISDLVDRKKQSSLIQHFDQEKISRYNKAMREHIFLLGDETEINGITADYTHLEFMLAYMKLRPGLTPLVYMQLVWGELWPYIKKVVDGFEANTMYLMHLIEDQDEVLKTNSDDYFEVQIYKKFMAEKASEVMRQQFQFFRKKMKADIEKQTKEAIAEMKKEQKE